MLNTKKVYELLQENKINELKELVRIELLTNDKKSSIKAGITSYYKHMQKANMSRSILQHCCYRNNLQYTTDSYIALELVKEDYITLFHEAENNYPFVEKCFIANNKIEKDFNLQDILNKCDVAILEKGLIRFLIDSEAICIDPKRFKLLIQGLQVNQKTIKLGFTSKFKPVTVMKENGSRGIILPVLHDENDLTTKIIDIE